MNKIIFYAAIIFFLFPCTAVTPHFSAEAGGDTIMTRFKTPGGYFRPDYKNDTFAFFLSHLLLKPENSPVMFFNGSVKQNQVHEAVIDMPILDRDLIQCADAIIKLRAEYFYSHKKYDRIRFHISNGMIVPFQKYLDGFRVRVNGNETEWVRGGVGGQPREIFDSYLKFLYAYAGTVSLSNELRTVNIRDIKTGDIFIEGGSPGHAVLVIDLATNRFTGGKVMMLAQSFMPSQEMHILKSATEISPWYEVGDESLITPEWTFPKGSLKRFAD